MRRCQDRDLRTSGKIAKSRARLTVAADRLGCSQEQTARMQGEILEILSRYMNLDGEKPEIRLEIRSRTRQGVQDVKTIQIE